jgi:hypothetical protein
MRKKTDSLPSFAVHTNQHATMPLEIQILQNIMATRRKMVEDNP